MIFVCWKTTNSQSKMTTFELEWATSDMTCSHQRDISREKKKLLPVKLRLTQKLRFSSQIKSYCGFLLSTTTKCCPSNAFSFLCSDIIITSGLYSDSHSKCVFSQRIDKVGGKQTNTMNAILIHTRTTLTQTKRNHWRQENIIVLSLCLCIWWRVQHSQTTVVCSPYSTHIQTP